jgi:hypothetical protein
MRLGAELLTMQDRLMKRLRKRAKRGMRGYPLATVAYYGPDMARASKVVVGIVLLPGTHDIADLRTWTLETGDVRTDAPILEAMLEHMDANGVMSVVMVDRMMGCPHQEGVDYDGRWCPVCTYWTGRDRYTGKMVETPEN